MRCSILILSKDRLFHISRCLESLATTCNQDDIEVLVGDTGTSDPKVFETYEKFGKSFRGRFEVVNIGKYHFSSNNNSLACQARGRFIVLLNNDTIAKPFWLENLLKALDHPWVGAAGPKLLFGHSSRIQHAGVEFLKKGPLRSLGYHVYRNRHTLLPEANLAKYVPGVTGACLATKKILFTKLGGFDPAFKEECQDIDFCLKIHSTNMRVAYDPSSVLYHYENGSRTTSENRDDRALFVKRWGDFIDENFFLKRFQSTPISKDVASFRENARFILFERKEARGDVFASTSLVKAYKESNPDTHVTFRTKYPELVDGVSFIDRAIGWDEPDDYRYDLVLKPTYESGEWKSYGHSWIEEMGRSLALPHLPKEKYRPLFQFSSESEGEREFYRRYSQKSPYVVFATTAGWTEKEWEPLAWESLANLLEQKGIGAIQIGSSKDYAVRGTERAFDRDLHGNLSIIESAKAMVTVESFPYHLGTAAKIPVVVLTCKTCTHTTLPFPEVVEMRNNSAQATPLPGCRLFGCRLKDGDGTDHRCSSPTLKSLRPEDVAQKVFELIEKDRSCSA